MIAARFGMLVLATVLVLAALGVRSADWQPSALRLLVTAAVGLLALLLWPGSAATPARTAARVVGWSAAAAAIAAAALRLVGNPVQPFERIAVACAGLLLILMLAHALIAMLESLWRDASADARDAREKAGRTLTIVLLLLCALPLWLGPVAELLSVPHAWAIDVTVGLSPLTHLAVASGNDLLRNDWFYRHSNLAALQFSYPDLARLAWIYASASCALVFIVLALGQRRRPDVGSTRSFRSKEKTK